MPIDLYKYSGLGRPLDAAEVDQNWTDIEAKVAEMEGGFTKLAAVELAPDGESLRFIGDDLSVMGTVLLPASLVNVGDWASGADYNSRHIVSHGGQAWFCMVAHAAGVFEDDRVAGYWLPMGSATGAAAIAFASSTGLLSDNVQDALEELNGALSELASQVDGLPDHSAAISTLQTKVANLETAVSAWADTDDQTSGEVSYDPATSGLTATTVKAALDELKAAIDAIPGGGTDTDDQTSAEVSYDPTVSGLAATDVKAAIDELKAAIDAIPGGAADTDDQTAAEVPFDPAASGMAATHLQGAVEELKAEIDALPSGGGSERIALVYIDLELGDGAITQTQWDEAAAIELDLTGTVGETRTVTVPATALGIRRVIVTASGSTSTVYLSGNGALNLPAGDACYDILGLADNIRNVSA